MQGCSTLPFQSRWRQCYFVCSHHALSIIMKFSFIKISFSVGVYSVLGAAYRYVTSNPFECTICSKSLGKRSFTATIHLMSVMSLFLKLSWVYFTFRSFSIFIFKLLRCSQLDRRYLPFQRIWPNFSGGRLCAKLILPFFFFFFYASGDCDMTVERYVCIL